MVLIFHSYVCLPEGNNNNIGIMDYFRFIYGMNIWDFFLYVVWQLSCDVG